MATNKAITDKLFELEGKIRVLEGKIQELQGQSGQGTKAETRGQNTPRIIDLDSTMFSIQSLTGASGEKFVARLDVVPIEPLPGRPHSGVGPTGADRGLWSRGVGIA